MLSLSSLFQLDGNAVTTVTSPLSHDWDQVYRDKGGTVSPDPGPSGTGALQFSADPINSSSDDTFTSTSKDTADINTWGWTSSKPNSKSDLEHGFAAAYQDEGYTTNGSVHTLLYVGADRYDNVGSSTLGVWFLHNPIAKSGTTSGGFVFKGTNTPYTHADGDVLFVANFASGSVSFTAYKWNSVTKTIPSVGTPLTPDQGLAFANANPVSVPWAYTTKSGKTSPQANQFLEFGVDLNQLFATSGASLPDFSSYIISTRTSNSATATLQDFIIREVSSAPDVAVTKTPDAAIVNAGSQVGYTVSVSNVGVGNLNGVTLSDPLPAGAASDLNWTFASGGNPGGLFQITGSVGNQVLSLISPQNMAFNAAPLVAHVVASSSTSDLGKITSTATVAAFGEGSNFLTNNTAAADIVIMPVAVNDTYSTPLNVTLTVPASGVLSNDGTPLTNVTATLVSGPSQGSLTMNANGDGGFTYTPARNSSSTVTFTYKDNLFGNFSNIATVTINIGANHPPVTVNDTNSVTEDSVLTASGNVLSNDSDVDAGTTLAATLVGSGAGTYGSLALSSGGGYTYTLNNSAAVVQGLAQGQSVTDTFTYAASDGITSTNGTLTITINGTNDGPVTVNDAGNTSEDTFVDLVVVANDTDIDSPNSALIVAAGSITNVHGGIATLQPDSRTVRFTPAADANGSNTPGGFGFDYKVSDGSLTSANTGTVTITVNAANDAPVAVNDTASTSEDTFVDVVVVANDTDIDSSNSVLVVAAGSITNLRGGTATLLADLRTIRFTPAADANGGNTPGGFGFDYKVSDGSLISANTGTVTITVNAANDAPVAVNDAASTSEDTFVDVVVVANDTDIDSSNSVLVVAAGSIANVRGGTATLQPDGRTVRFTPAADADGGNTPGGFGFDYKVSDGSLTSPNTGTVTITVNAANDAPVAVNDAASTSEDTFVDVVVVSNDTDIDSSNSVLVVAAGSITNVHGGTATLQPDGRTVRFTPTADANSGNTPGGFGFDYKVSDGSLTSANTGTVTITVNAANDVPVAVNDAASATEAGGVANGTAGSDATGNVLINDLDVDSGDTKTVVTLSGGTVGLPMVGAYGSLTLNSDGSFTYAVNNSDAAVQALLLSTDTLTETFSYTMRDAAGAVSNSANLVITIHGQNDAPTIGRDNATVSVSENASAGNTGTFADHDDAVTITASVGSVTQNNAAHTWSWSFTPTDGPDGSQTVTIFATDSIGAVVTTTFSLVVTNVAPTVTLSGPTSADEGQTQHYTFTTSDPGVDTFSILALSGGSAGTVSNQFFNGGTGTGSFDVTFSDGPATSTVSIQVQDSDGAASNTSTVSVNIANVVPTMTLTGSSSVNQLRSYVLTLGAVNDPGTDTVTQYVVAWGDGQTDTIPAASLPANRQLSHTYADPQVVTIEVDVTDEDGTHLGIATKLVTVTALSTSAQFDFNNAASPTEPGYTAVTPSASYTVDQGFGWTDLTGLTAADRGVPTTLLRDLQSASGTHLFLADLAPGQYFANVTIGDASFDRDNIQVAANGTVVLPDVDTTAGQFVHSMFPVTIGSDAVAAFQFSDGGGANPLWVVNALEVRSQVSTVSFSGPGTVDADGASIDTVTGQLTALSVNTLITLRTSLGQIVSADANPDYQGIQVLVPAGATTFTFQIRRPSGSGTPTLTAMAVDGRAYGTATNAAVLNYTLPAVRRFDFNSSKPDDTPTPTAAGFIGVRGRDLYDPVNGYGFATDTSDITRGGSGYTKSTYDLYEDFAFGTVASGARVFQVAVTTGAGYDVRVYTGDRNAALNNLRVRIEGQTTTQYSKIQASTAANFFTNLTFTNVMDVNANGILEIELRDLGNAAGYADGWAVNGLDIADTGSLPAAAPQALPGLTFDANGMDATSQAVLSSFVQGGETLTDDRLATTVADAIARWSSLPLTADQRARLTSIDVQIADLDSQGELGLAGSGHVLIDNDALGLGWHVGAGAVPAGQMDLLSVVLHELGHIVGYGDLDPQQSPTSLMAGTLEAGQRRGLEGFDLETGTNTSSAPLDIDTLATESGTSDSFRIVAGSPELALLPDSAGTDTIAEQPEAVDVPILLSAPKREEHLDNVLVDWSVVLKQLDAMGE